MIVTIQTGEGKEQTTTNYDVNNVGDDAKRQEATITVSKVGTLGVVIEALDFASRTHRANLEKLLLDCPEAIVETERARNDKGQFVADDPETIINESVVNKESTEVSKEQ